MSQMRKLRFKETKGLNQDDVADKGRVASLTLRREGCSLGNACGIASPVFHYFHKRGLQEPPAGSLEDGFSAAPGGHW